MCEMYYSSDSENDDWEGLGGNEFLHCPQAIEPIPGRRRDGATTDTTNTTLVIDTSGQPKSPSRLRLMEEGHH